MEFLPGTVFEIEKGKLMYGFANLATLITVTKGLTLSQVCDITGMEPTTIQNWIKRDWVAHPVEKRYGEYQVARIIILNMLRSSLQLEKIALLLRYVNGEADNRNDDIIPDSQLYTHLCRIIDEVLRKNITDTQNIRIIVNKSLEDYKEKYDGAKAKLINALTVMTLAYIASTIKNQAEIIINQIL